MRGGLLLMALVLAACSGPAKPKIILPGKLDLSVSADDELRSACPSEAPGTEKDSPIDCLYGAATDAFAPYAKQLKEKGWASIDQQTWSGPANADGVHGCLVVRSFQSNFRRRERTVLEFELVDPAIGCPVGGGAHA
ncbi:MAG: hypothetical protein QM773_00725 [Hyphomonadaceae bacterium]